jgi:hypothetical protein
VPGIRVSEPSRPIILFSPINVCAMAQMDCYPTKAIMDSVVNVPRHPAPSNIVASKKNSVEKLLYLTERFTSAKYRGFYATCMFCGFSRKGNSSQFRVHFTKESEGGTTCSPCPKVPAAITDFYIEQRDIFLTKKGSKNMEAATALHNAVLDDGSLPSSSQESNLSKRSRQSSERDPAQPSIHQALVSLYYHCN